MARDESGRVFFVPYSAPGDRVRVRIVREEKRYVQAELLEILEPSSSRQKPPCPVFGRCGGCQWQQLPYEVQWKTKVQGVEHALSRVQVPKPAGWDELPADRIWGYRNRIQLRGTQEQVGFYAKGSHEIVPIERCEIARPEINAKLPEIRQEGKRHNRPYKVEVEVLPDGSVRSAWNVRHAASGFRQVHDEQNAKLQAWVGGVLRPGRVLYDLFGGSGNLALPLTQVMTEVHSVDLLRHPPGELPPGFQFHDSAVLSWLMRWASKSKRIPSSAILDPPREGLGSDFQEIARCLEALGVDEIVTVGCVSDSWARDISRWMRRGWRLERVAVLDLFPQTPHVESIGLLRN